MEYLSNLKLREIITATTNKVEAYNELSDWVFFAGNVIVSSNDPEEMEKAIKYNLLISNCVILQIQFINYKKMAYSLPWKIWLDLAHI